MSLQLNHYGEITNYKLQITKNKLQKTKKTNYKKQKTMRDKLIEFWNKCTGKSKPTYVEAKEKIKALEKSVAYLITAKKGLERHKITVDINYKATRLKSGKTLFLRVLNDMLIQSQFIEDTKSVEVIKKQIIKVKNEL